MDNNRISDAARDKVQKAKASEVSAEERKRIFAVKASRSNRTMSNEYDLLH